MKTDISGWDWKTLPVPPDPDNEAATRQDWLSFGQELAEWREAQEPKCRQSDLARLLGVTRIAVYFYEKSRRSVGRKTRDIFEALRQGGPRAAMDRRIAGIVKEMGGVG